MKLPFGLSAYSRFDGRMAQVRLVNLYPEPSPTSETGMVLIPRQGLHQEYDLGGPITGLFQADGVYGGGLFAVSGGHLFNGEDDLGAVAFDGRRAEFAYTVDGLFILSGGVVHQYNGETLEPTEFPDDAEVASIAAINQTLVAIRADTGTVYFRLPGDTEWNALDFFSAEREPDPAICVRALTDALYVFGTSSVEVFAPTGDAERPFDRIDGLAITRGLKDRDSVVRLDNTLFFVGEDGIAYRVDGVPKRISDHGVEERLQASSTAACWSYVLAGHAFWVVRLDTETLAYDVASEAWHELVWPVCIGLDEVERTWVACGTAIHTLRDQAHDNGAGFERIFTAVLPTDKPGSVNAIQVNLSPGVTPVGDEPAILQMRWSDNQGRTWTDWKDANTGFGGEYRKRVLYRRGGMVDAPGRVMEFRMTDPVVHRFSGVELNPFGGGRSRG